MPLFAFLTTRRTKKADPKAAKLARNDEQRHTKSLLEIALRKQSSVNSLTSSDPARAHVERQKLVAEREAEREADAEKVRELRDSAKREEEEIERGQQAKKQAENREELDGLGRDMFARMGTVSMIDGYIPGREDEWQAREKEC